MPQLSCCSHRPGGHDAGTSEHALQPVRGGCVTGSEALSQYVYAEQAGPSNARTSFRQVKSKHSAFG
jgi:hypothetical protein